VRERLRNCLTVDVEDWFHVCGAGGPLAFQHWDTLPSRIVDTTRDLLGLLDSCGVRGTFFVLGWVAARHPELIRDIASAGHEIGSHGHLHRRVFELTPQTFSDDLEASRAALAAAGVDTVRGFRAPEWSINDRSLWALEVLARSGFTFDSSMAPLRIVGDPSYPQRPHTRTTACGDLLEFPPLVGRRFGQNMPLGLGWGLRMTNPARIVDAIDAHNRLGIPVALAVHPWEIDPSPPQVKLPLATSFAHYFRLDGFRARLERVLRGTTFAPMGEVLGLSPVSP
jgi:polysaccharide deacetylase family protein (PEP-CTERM system associated)